MKILLTAFAFLICSGLSAQEAVRQSDWQQRVDYEIHVELDDSAHMLDGQICITYTNNSPNDLRRIFIHAWPNAYEDNNTPFARQLVENGKLDFQFAKESDRGWMRDMKFVVDGKPVRWEYDSLRKDVCVLYLNRWLFSGEKAVITTPFRVKIPGRFSRFGHAGQNYQITQWFPKPAVYDVNGWNPISYHDQGEFYSDFGSFDVSISVPENYVVAATGELMDQKEWDFIEHRIANPIDPEMDIPSATKLKTLHYKQDSIHDFAWFAGKNLNIESSEVEIEGHTIRTLGFAPKQDFDYTSWIERGLKYYSEHIGPYPYDYCSVVYGALEAGGGMEYPMITVISAEQQEVVVHEVGHNWFYGILGSNEKRYPWMDESLNSYFDSRATSFLSFRHASLERPTIISNLFNINDFFLGIGAMYSERQETHQAIGASSLEFTEMNYGTMVYGKGALVLKHLEAYLGTEMMDSCFKEYYETWKFRHPLPGDMQDVFERTSGTDLTWFFRDVINTEKHIDYAIDALSDSSITIVNRGDIQAPFVVGFFKEGDLMHEERVDQVNAEKVTVPINTSEEYDLVKIDPYEDIFEPDQSNNSMRTSGMFPKMEPVSFNLLALIENPNASMVSWLPIVGYNINDNWMAGVYVSNMTLPGKKLKYSLSTLFSFSNQELNGLGRIEYSHHAKAHMWKKDIGVEASRFSTRRLYDHTYTRIRPYVLFGFQPSDLRSKKFAEIELSTTIISFKPQFDIEQRKADVMEDTTGHLSLSEFNSDQFVDLRFSFGNRKALDPCQTNIRAQWGNYSANRYIKNENNSVDDQFVKIEIDHSKKFHYRLSKLTDKGINFRFYGGYYPDPADDRYYQFRLSPDAGRFDYTYQYLMMGRAAGSGLWSRQVTLSGYQSKLVGNMGNVSDDGDQWIAAFNVRADIPVKLPIALYADVFSFAGIESHPGSDGSIAYSAGLQLNVLTGFLQVYFPLSTSQFILDAQDLKGIDSFGKRISFSMDLNSLKLDKLLDYAGF